MTNPEKEKKLRESLNKINKKIEYDVTEIYDWLKKESQNYNVNTIDAFLRNKEPEKIDNYIIKEISNIKSEYINALQEIKYNDDKYSRSQAILMWGNIEGKIKNPVLKPFEKTDEIKILNEVKNKGNQSNTDITKDMVIILTAVTGIIEIAMPVIPTFLGVTSLVISAITTGYQKSVNNRWPLGLFEDNKERNSPVTSKPEIDFTLLKKLLDAQKNLTIKTLKSWSEFIFDLVVREEPLL